MSDTALVNGMLTILRETFEGGEPGKGTGFLDNTKADGSGNSGVFATLDALSASQASQPTALGASVASHAAHLAFHIEASVRYAKGDRGRNDWQASFEPRAVDDAGWRETRGRVRGAYDELLALARGVTEWNEDHANGLAATLAHAAYHLGAIRQIAKLATSASASQYHSGSWTR